MSRKKPGAFSADPAHAYAQDAEGIDAVARLVTAVRGVRAEQGLEPGAMIELEIHAKQHEAVLKAAETIIARLVRAEKLAWVSEELRAAEGAAVAVDPAFEAAVKLGGGDREADREAEKMRLLKQLEEARKGLEATEKRLANPQFVERAKPEVVEGARKQAEGLRATIASAEERLGALG